MKEAAVRADEGEESPENTEECGSVVVRITGEDDASGDCSIMIRSHILNVEDFLQQ